MALQDLTPQLRTRLSRLERIVGIFVAIATLLMRLAGISRYAFEVACRVPGVFTASTMASSTITMPATRPRPTSRR